MKVVPPGLSEHGILLERIFSVPFSSKGAIPAEGRPAHQAVAGGSGKRALRSLRPPEQKGRPGDSGAAETVFGGVGDQQGEAGFPSTPEGVGQIDRSHAPFPVIGTCAKCQEKMSLGEEEIGESAKGPVPLFGRKMHPDGRDKNQGK